MPMAKRIQASDAGTPERSRQVDHFRRAACRLNVNVRLLAWGNFKNLASLKSMQGDRFPLLFESSIKTMVK